MNDLKSKSNIKLMKRVLTTYELRVNSGLKMLFYGGLKMSF